VQEAVVGVERLHLFVSSLHHARMAVTNWGQRGTCPLKTGKERQNLKSKLIQGNVGQAG